METPAEPHVHPVSPLTKRVFNPNQDNVSAIKLRLASRIEPMTNDELAYATGLSLRRTQELTKHLVSTGEIQECRLRSYGRMRARFYITPKGLAASA